MGSWNYKFKFVSRFEWSGWNVQFDEITQIWWCKAIYALICEHENLESYPVFDFEPVEIIEDGGYMVVLSILIVHSLLFPRVQ